VSPTTFGDAANVLKGNILQTYGDEPSEDGAPIAEGAIEGLLEGSLFLGLQDYYKKYGGVYKLLFGPKSFMVISDPTIIRHILRDNAKAYDKGILAEILAPIMGKGLIPADPETWKVRFLLLLYTHPVAVVVVLAVGCSCCCCGVSDHHILLFLGAV
jgi:hypothetical protein